VDVSGVELEVRGREWIGGADGDLVPWGAQPEGVTTPAVAAEQQIGGAAVEAQRYVGVRAEAAELGQHLE
jgi:hypothetical protein